MLIRRMPLILAVVAMFAIVATANATVVIKTNADCELRESSQSTVFDDILLTDVVVPDAGNRGNSTELATRVKAGARSSVSYIKFPISDLPDVGDAFWTTNKKAKLQIRLRHENLPESRLRALRPGATSASTSADDWNYDPSATSDQAAQMQFAVYGLDPNGTYSTTKTDRSGNAYAAPQSVYEWSEGDGSEGSGITFYDAPGITPHCMVSGTCDTAEYGGAATDTLQSKGYIDDFNSNVIPLGTWNWPDVQPQNHLPVGLPVDFSSAALLDLIQAAKAAGRDSVTLIVAHNLDPLKDGSYSNLTVNPDDLTEIDPITGLPVPTGMTLDPEALPTSFFNFNYIMNPKEQDPMRTDTGYDSDVTDEIPAEGSPWSGLPNVDGQYASKLFISVPEPSSLLLVGLAMAGLAMACRRK